MKRTKTAEARETLKVTNSGAKIPKDQMDKALDLWIGQEKDGSSVSKTAIGRELGLERAPEWLDGKIFQGQLQLRRFDLQLDRLKTKQEVMDLTETVLDAALREGYRRLIEDPESIPSTVLYGDLLIKMIRLRHDLTTQDDTKPVGNIFIQFKNELNAITDPVVKQRVERMVMATYEQALQLGIGKNEPAGDVVDVVATPVTDKLKIVREAPVDNPEPDDTGRRRLWDDLASPEAIN